ncbi:MAG: hypothetical protein Q9221_008875 [Calogaya cf. arnoldii]
MVHPYDQRRRFRLEYAFTFDAILDDDGSETIHDTITTKYFLPRQSTIQAEYKETDKDRCLVRPLFELLTLLKRHLEKSAVLMATAKSMDPMKIRMWDMELYNLVAMMRSDDGMQEEWIREGIAIRKRMEGDAEPAKSSSDTDAEGLLSDSSDN